jgi:tripartite-type tricarboxylate transporter receptor subunit TctC
MGFGIRVRGGAVWVAFRTSALTIGLAMAAAWALSAPAAHAQGREGRIIVGNQPGGATDIVARLMAPVLAAGIGHPYVVENRAGASGNIAAEAVAKAAPDGSTILLVFNSHTTVGALFPKLPFDPIRDFAPIGLVAQAPYLVVARPDIGVDTFRELLDRTRQTHKPVTMGSPGRATPQHLMMEKLRKEEGVPIEVAHYKGTAPAQTDVMGGHIDFTLATPSASAGFVRAGKLKLLAVTAERRLPDFPNAPTAGELGIRSVAGTGVWIALLVPAKTPRPVVERLNEIVNDAVRSPEVSAKLAAVGFTPMGGTPEELDRLMRDEQRTWSALIRENAITAD